MVIQEGEKGQTGQKAEYSNRPPSSPYVDAQPMAKDLTVEMLGGVDGSVIGQRVDGLARYHPYEEVEILDFLTSPVFNQHLLGDLNNPSGTAQPTDRGLTLARSHLTYLYNNPSRPEKPQDTYFTQEARQTALKALVYHAENRDACLKPVGEVLMDLLKDQFAKDPSIHPLVSREMREELYVLALKNLADASLDFASQKKETKSWYGSRRKIIQAALEAAPFAVHQDDKKLARKGIVAISQALAQTNYEAISRRRASEYESQTIRLVASKAEELLGETSRDHELIASYTQLPMVEPLHYADVTQQVGRLRHAIRDGRVAARLTANIYSLYEATAETTRAHLRDAIGPSNSFSDDQGVLPQAGEIGRLLIHLSLYASPHTIAHIIESNRALVNLRSTLSGIAQSLNEISAMDANAKRRIRTTLRAVYDRISTHFQEFPYRGEDISGFSWSDVVPESVRKPVTDFVYPNGRKTKKRNAVKKRIEEETGESGTIFVRDSGNADQSTHKSSHDGVGDAGTMPPLK